MRSDTKDNGDDIIAVACARITRASAGGGVCLSLLITVSCNAYKVNGYNC